MLAFEIISSLVASTVIAVLALRYLMRRPPPHQSNGPWRIDLTLGSERAGLWTKAFTAWHSLFALRTPETIYFSANRDSDGNRLECSSAYCVNGTDLDARWWSLTAYQNSRLIPNSAGRYSFSTTTVQRKPDGSWTIRVSAGPQPENWLPAGESGGRFGLVLRFYGPGAGLLADPAGVALPQIRREPNS